MRLLRLSGAVVGYYMYKVYPNVLISGSTVMTFALAAERFVAEARAKTTPLSHNRKIRCPET